MIYQFFLIGLVPIHACSRKVLRTGSLQVTQRKEKGCFVSTLLVQWDKVNNT